MCLAPPFKYVPYAKGDPESQYQAAIDGLTEEVYAREEARWKAPLDTQGQFAQNGFRTELLEIKPKKTKNAEGYDLNLLHSFDPNGQRQLVAASLVVQPFVGLPPVDSQRKWFIAGEAPSEDTKHAFLAMLLNRLSSSKTPPNQFQQARVDLIIQLIDPLAMKKDKSGKTYPQCAPYLPTSPDKPRIVHDPERKAPSIEVRMSTATSSTDHNGFLKGWEVTDLVVRYMSGLDVQWRAVKHVFLEGWANKNPVKLQKAFSFNVPQGVIEPHTLAAPSPARHMATFVLEMHQYLKQCPNSLPLVHCDSAKGRTGETLLFLHVCAMLDAYQQHQNTRVDPASILQHRVDQVLSPDFFVQEEKHGVKYDFVGMMRDNWRAQRVGLTGRRDVETRFIYEVLEEKWGG
ncbi:protein tyrosine phosphatase [Pseudohyphozyma bogoriensis]|nr:protein tyrosine phosphatase [Pseudohyphozyma bogoriensis]